MKSVGGLAAIGKMASFSGPSSVSTGQTLTRSKTMKPSQGPAKDA